MLIYAFLSGLSSDFYQTGARGSKFRAYLLCQFNMEVLHKSHNGSLTLDHSQSPTEAHPGTVAYAQKRLRVTFGLLASGKPMGENNSVLKNQHSDSQSHPQSHVFLFTSLIGVNQEYFTNITAVSIILRGKQAETRGNPRLPAGC